MDDQNRPVGCLQYQEKYGQYNAYFIGDEEKVIYLTFDEGYENGYTASILDTLQEKGVQAVFFITGDYLDAEPELVGRMIAEGHAVGNHSENHPSFPGISPEKQREELATLAKKMEENYQYKMTLFRPPCGEFSERMLANVQDFGYTTVFWSYAYKDWDPESGIGAEAACEKAVNALHDGAIYLLHAVSSDNAEMLGDFIDEARAKGYTFSLFGQ